MGASQKGIAMLNNPKFKNFTAALEVVKQLSGTLQPGGAEYVNLALAEDMTPYITLGKSQILANHALIPDHLAFRSRVLARPQRGKGDPTGPELWSWLGSTLLVLLKDALKVHYPSALHLLETRPEFI